MAFCLNRGTAVLYFYFIACCPPVKRRWSCYQNLTVCAVTVYTWNNCYHHWQYMEVIPKWTVGQSQLVLPTTCLAFSSLEDTKYCYLLFCACYWHSKEIVVCSGSIIRCMRRLEEVLRQLCQAAKNIGNTDLENKFSEAIKVIKRDIVFAASLYLWCQNILAHSSVMVLGNFSEFQWEDLNCGCNDFKLKTDDNCLIKLIQIENKNSVWYFAWK
jgi:hypothetical protein